MFLIHPPEDVDSDKSTAVVHGIVGGIPIPFSIPVPDGCRSGIQCPIKTGNTYNYQASLPVKTEYPSVSMILSSSDVKFCSLFLI